MNKDKLIEWIDKEIKHLIWEHNNIAECQSECLKGIEELNKIKSFIQSEPEETKPIEIEGVKTNTYTKEKVAELILEYALDLENSKNFAIDMDTDDVIYWLNEKAGE